MAFDLTFAGTILWGNHFAVRADAPGMKHAVVRTWIRTGFTGKRIRRGGSERGRLAKSAGAVGDIRVVDHDEFRHFSGLLACKSIPSSEPCCVIVTILYYAITVPILRYFHVV